MSARKKIILSFISIFILGAITGAAVAPAILDKLIGNPYSEDVVARRVFNAEFLDTSAMAPDQAKAVDDIVAKYVSQYRVMKAKFTDQRFNLYAAFKSELKNILNEKEYSEFLAESERAMREREKYHKEKEAEWRKAREKSKYYNKNYEKAAREMYESRIPTGTKTDGIQNETGEDEYYYGDPQDVYNRYMFDKKRYGWKTFDESQVIHDEND